MDCEGLFGFYIVVHGSCFPYFVGCDISCELDTIDAMFSFCPAESQFTLHFWLSNFVCHLIVGPRLWFFPTLFDCCEFTTFYWLCSLSHFWEQCRLPLSFFFYHDRAKHDSGVVFPY